MSYQNGKIYAIRSPHTDKIYIGSTIQTLCKRKWEHHCDNYNPKRVEKICTSKQIMDFGDYYIELLENYPCNTREELNKREGELQRLHNCVNHFKMSGVASKVPMIVCDCGMELRKFMNNRNRHLQSFVHQSYLASIEEEKLDL
jgi:hypothetical protein